jgi:hypothetical protein
VIVLRDDRLQPIGGLYTGTVVRLREDPTAASGKWADVEIAAPIVVGGRVERDRLLVFAGVDLEVEPGLAWVLAGAPLAILSGDAQRARVIVASPHGEKPQLRPVEVPCTLLRGTPPSETIGWDAIGPLLPGRDRVPGRPVSWVGDRVLESDAGAPSVPVEGRAFTYDQRRRAPILIRIEGERALVEIVDNWHWTRVRGWTAREGLRHRYPHLPEAFCGCANSGEWLTLISPAKPNVTLADATPLRSIADGRVVATLPRDAVVTPRRIGETESLVVWTDRARPRDPPHLALIGRIPTAALGTLSAGRVNAVVVGRVKPARPGAALPDQLVIDADPNFHVFLSRLRIPVAKDGSFRFVAPANNDRLGVSVQTPGGQTLSEWQLPVELKPGKTSTVSITLRADDIDDHGAER